MTKDQIIEKTNTALADEFEKDMEIFTPEAEIRAALELDSLGLVDMVALLESEIGVKIKGQEIVKVKTFGDLYDFLEEKVKEA